MKNKILFTLFIVFFSFVLNFIWEHLHAPLYTVGGKPVELFRLLYSTIGDVVIILGIYLAVALIARNFYWIRERRGFIILAIFFGGVVALLVEYRAMLENRWQYTSAMPIMPFFQIGLSPFFQMIILPTVIYVLSDKMGKRL